MLRALLSLIVACIILGLIYLFYPVFVITGKPLLFINMWNEEKLPKNFRMSTDTLRQESGYNPSLIGLNELQASASAQFSEKSLDLLLQKIPTKQVTIVDLRQESHGFINGIAVSWYIERDWLNKGKTLDDIEEDETHRLRQAADYPITIAYASRKFPIPLWVKNSYTEEELISNHHLGYMRIPVTDHLKPSNQDVDQFINFVKSFPQDSLWLHFHCAAGEGRSTTFLVMYDMMRNATKVKLQDIFMRQYLLGGANFQNETATDWRKSYNDDRKKFLREFYVYCQQNPHFQKSWSVWLTENKDREKNKIYEKMALLNK